MADDVTPAQTASFDQVHALVSEHLDGLISAYRAALADGEHPGLAMAGMADWMRANEHPDAMGDLLAVAVSRLVEQGEGGTR